MIIRIHNFGPIKEFEFDLNKDFHVVYGKNNIGKSYAITVVYLVLKNVFNIRYLTLAEIVDKREKFNRNNKEINNLKKIIETKPARYEEFKIQKQFENLLKSIFTELFINQLQKSLEITFSDISQLSNKKNKYELSLVLIFEDFEIEIGLNSKNKLFINDFKLKQEVKVKSVDSTRGGVVERKIN